MADQPRPRLGLDLDSTTNDFDERMVDYLQRYYDPTVSLENWTSWDVAACFGAGAKAHMTQAMRYDDFWRGLRPREGVVRALCRLIQRYEVLVVTSRHESLHRLTREWLAIHEIPHDGLYVVQGDPIDKVAVLRELGCDVVSDDNQAIGEACVEAGIVTVQLARPWNHDAEGICRVSDWQALEEALGALTGAL